MMKGQLHCLAAFGTFGTKAQQTETGSNPSMGLDHDVQRFERQG